jgi:uncharacterized protein (TIGR00266 family)
MQYKIQGDVFPTLEISLKKGDSIFTEAGAMAWMSEGLEMTSNTRGGLMKGLGRALAGESLFMTTYESHSDNAWIVFTVGAPGRIMEFKLDAGQTLICQKDTFLCAEQGVSVEMHFRKQLGAGLFGGEGFILQKVTGPGTVFLEIPGALQERTLAAGEKILIDPGHIAFFEPSVKYDISMVKGLKNVLFAGEGLFLATLSGPGKIWLETLPLSNLAAKLKKYIPTKSG